MRHLNQIREKINKSYWLRSGSFSFLTKMSESGFGLLTFFVLVRLLDQKEFGAWVLLISVSAITESLRKAFVANPLIRFTNITEEEEHNCITSASVIQNTIYTLLTSSVIFFLAPLLSDLWNSPDLYLVLKVFAISNIFVGFFSICNFIQQAHLKFNGTFYAAVLRKGLFFLFALYCLLYWKNVTLVQLVISQILIFILIIPINLKFTLPYYTRFQWSKSRLYNILHFGKYTIGTNLSSMAFGNIDSWLIATLLTVKEVALYNPAIRILALVEIPVVSLSVIAYPKLTQRIRDDDMEGAKRLYEKSLGTILAFIIPVGILITFFAEYIVLILAGENYLEATPILQITILFGLFIPFNRQLGITLNAMGKPQLNLIFVLVNLVINIACNYLFIIEFGLMGAAYGTLLAYILSVIYGQTLGYYLFKTSTLSVLKYTFKFILRPKQILDFKQHEKK